MSCLEKKFTWSAPRRTRSSLSKKFIEPRATSCILRAATACCSSWYVSNSSCQKVLRTDPKPATEGLRPAGIESEAIEATASIGTIGTTVLARGAGRDAGAAVRG